MVTREGFGALATATGLDLCAGLEAVVVRGRSLFKLVDLAEAQGLVVLGLDGLKLDGGDVVPLNDYVADFGEIGGPWESRVQLSAAAARQLARVWGPMPDLVEVTLGGLDE